MLFLVLAFVSVPSRAQAPAGATGVCNDGSFSTASSKRGACSGHQGIKTWYATALTSPTAVSPSANTAPPVAPSSPSATVATPRSAAPMPSQAPGGGNGQVWVNTPTKVYRCPSDRYYGKTQTGVYMTETARKRKGIGRPTEKPGRTRCLGRRPATLLKAFWSLHINTTQFAILGLFRNGDSAPG